MLLSARVARWRQTCAPRPSVWAQRCSFFDSTQLPQPVNYRARVTQARVKQYLQPVSYTRATYKLEDTIGFATSRGPRMRNEDRYCYDVIRDFEHTYLLRPSHDRANAVAKCNPIYLFGVFDGHSGNRASTFMSRHLIPYLSQNAELDENDMPPTLEDRLVTAIRELNARFCEKATRRNFSDGSTACIIAIDPLSHLAVVANVGDSRAVLCERGRAVPLTKDHRPYHEDEHERIEQAGGLVVTGHDGTRRLMGLLETSRVIGNVAMRQFGAIAEPTMTEVRLDDYQHSFMVLATDGLFRVMSGQEIVDVVKESPTPQLACDTLVHKAIFEYGTPDDTTVMVLPLVGWGNYHNFNYTAKLREFGLTHVFGYPILEIPKNVMYSLDNPDVSLTDLILSLFSVMDADSDARLSHYDVKTGLLLLGNDLTEDEVDMIMLVAAIDGETITFRDFVDQFPGVELTDVDLTV